MNTTRFDNELTTYLQAQEKFLKDPKEEATLTIGSPSLLGRFVDPQKLQGRLDRLAEMRYEKAHLQYLATLEKFDQDFLDHLNDEPPQVKVLAKENKMKVIVEGFREDLPLWEVPIMLQIRDLYYTGALQADNLDYDALVGEGVRRFQVKGDMLRHSGVRFVEAGTRYRYGYEWHALLFQLMIGDMGELLLGTTNLAMAMAFALKPVDNLAGVLRIESPSVSDLENLVDTEPRPIVVTGLNAFQMAHLYGHFGDHITFEWDRDLTGDMGPMGTFLPLTSTVQ